MTDRRGLLLDTIFKPPLDDKFKCAQCRRLLHEPWQVTCGHRYCRSCLDELLIAKSGGFCPACEQELAGNAPSAEALSDGLLSQRNVHEDAAMKRDIGKQKCVCPHQPCTWGGLFRDYEKHVELECRFVKAACPQQCGFTGLPSEMERHKNECPLRQAICPHCKLTTGQSLLEVHMLTCSKRPVPCVYCSKSVPPEELQAHQDSLTACARTYMPCPFGCKDPIKPDNMDKHKEKCVYQHMEYLLADLVSLAKKTGGAGGTLQIGDVPRGDGAMQLPQASGSVADRSAWISRVLASDHSISAATEALYADVDKQLTAHVDNISLYNAMKLAIETYMKENEGAQKLVEDRKRAVERHVHMKDAGLQHMSITMDNVELATYDGTLLWKVSDVSQRRQDALNNRVPSIYSHSFYTSRVGYKMCARLYLNGDGTGKGTHMSLFFVLQKGPYDALLKWPFTQKVTLMLLNQSAAVGGSGKDLVDAFRADPNSSSFRRPVSEMNIASGCPTFCSIADLLDSNKGYVKDDTLFIKITVDRTGLVDP